MTSATFRSLHRDLIAIRFASLLGMVCVLVATSVMMTAPNLSAQEPSAAEPQNSVSEKSNSENSESSQTVSPRDGKAIYQELCASCHGGAGEGVPGKFAAPLVGDRPVIDLAKLIEETMPEEDPSQCVGEDAQKVAQYIYDEFYSEVAQARRRPARTELSRLTVPQYRNAIMDLIGSFRYRSRLTPDRGLLVSYFDSRGLNPRRKADEGIVDEVNFHWGTKGPLPEQLINPEFAIRWDGSLIAPETGTYDFILRTNNGTRLWLNNNRVALIDAWVRSGNDQEYRSSIFLVGGRPYPLRLEFFKAKEDPMSSIELAWRLPSGRESIISSRFLTPQRFPELLVPSTPFPPDDRSIGYERGTTISKAWEQATTMAAIEVADAVAKRLPELAGFGENDPASDIPKVKEFATNFVRRAIRRPLTPEEQTRWVDRHFENSPSLETSIKRVVLLTLKSPSFLYLDRNTSASDAHQIASRLSFAIWDSLPDEQLLQKAADNELLKPEVQREQVWRMLRDDRAKAKLRQFVHHWLGTTHAVGLSKSKELYPDFDEQILADLQTSLDLFIDDIVESEKPDFRNFLNADYLYLNDRLAKLYGYELATSPIAGTQSAEHAKYHKVSIATDQRMGVLSHPLVLSMYSYHNASSPIHRGVFMTRHILGRRLKPPPEAVAPFSEDLHPSLTTRERTILQTRETTCKACHGMINNLGFALEQFDAIGKIRNDEKGKPIDASGEYLQKNGTLVKFSGVKELSTFLINSPEAQDAFIEQLFHHLVKQPVRAYGTDTPDQLRNRFTDNSFDIRKLIVDITEIACRTVAKPSTADQANLPAANTPKSTSPTEGPLP